MRRAGRIVSAVVCLACVSVLGAAPDLKTASLLAAFDAGNHVVEPGSPPISVRAILTELPSAGSDLLRVSPADQERPRRVIAAFALEAARVGTNTGQSSAAFDLLTWARVRLIQQRPGRRLEPGTVQPRSAVPVTPNAFDVDWWHAAIALLENEYYPALLSREVAAGLDQCPDDPRLRVAAIVASEQEIEQTRINGQAVPAATMALALRRAGEASRIPDAHGEAELRWGRLLLQTDKPADALVHLDEALPRVQDLELVFFAHLLRGRTLAALGRVGEAAASDEAALAVAPGAESAMLALAAARWQAGAQDHADVLAHALLAKPEPAPDPWPLYSSGDARTFRSLLLAMFKDLS